MTRGFYGVAVYHPKNTVNVGTLWRSAHLLDASFFATIGRRYKYQPSDTYKSTRHVPLFEYAAWADFKANRPKDCAIIGVELSEGALDLSAFKHPQRAIYVLGAEDYGLPEHVLKDCDTVVKLRGERSMNVAVAGSIVLYHREALQ